MEQVIFTQPESMHLYYGGLVYLWVIPVLIPTTLVLIIAMRRKRISRLILSVLPGIYIILFVGLAAYSGSKESFEGYFYMLFGQTAFLCPNIATILLGYTLAFTFGLFKSMKVSSEKLEK